MLRLAAVLGAMALAAFPLLSTARGQGAPPVLSVRGLDMRAHGRIILGFDVPPKVTVRVTDSIIVLNFSEPVRIASEKLATDLGAYVSVVRRDPDGRALRLALLRPVRVNLMEAGEQVFVDLLPSTWTGLPPGLPQDVVDNLAQRARQAETRLREITRQREAEDRKPLTYTVGSLPTLTRLVLQAPGDPNIAFSREGETARLVFDARLAIDADAMQQDLPGIVRDIRVENAGAKTTLSFTLAREGEIRAFREDDTFVLDIEKPGTLRHSPEARVERAEKRLAADAAPAGLAPSAAPAPVARAPGNNPSGNAVTTAPAAAAASPAVRPTPVPDGPVVVRVSGQAETLKLTFPFATAIPAAAVELDGQVTLVFETSQVIEPPALIAPADIVSGPMEVSRQGRVAVARLTLTRPRLVRLSPDGPNWVLTLGDEALSPSQPLPVMRDVDEAGRTIVHVPLAEMGGIHWLDDPVSGRRLAIATARAPAQGLPKLHRFAEFRLLPAVHGVAVEAFADDIVVRPALDGVGIGRDGGLAVSIGQQPVTTRAGNDQPRPVIGRDNWAQLQAGIPRDRWRELADAAADSTRSTRAQARRALGTWLIANQFSAEGRGVLLTVLADNPELANDRALRLWLALAETKMFRDRDAMARLKVEALADDPEAILWRAVLDARAQRWPLALAGFKRTQETLDAYPDELQAMIRPAIVRAGLEMRDLSEAERALDILSRLPQELQPEAEIQLLRARLDEATARPEIALAHYEAVRKGANRPAAAEATLRGTLLALKEKTINAADAMQRLETLTVMWRGDDLELRAMGALGRLYAEAGRWRDAFSAARWANAMFPEHEITRALHDETAARFEELFLTGRGDSFPRVDALALYYDFKEFTPIGRRGDEMIRRLADRLVQLDLLDQAGDLLEHQVENRLTGSARATVAARLATIRLMDGKAALALQTLQNSRLPELPGEVRRARLLLEARALSDLSRTDLAIEMLIGEDGPEVKRLRADILWKGRRWREAGEAFETILGSAWQGVAPLTEQARRDVLRAAIAYSLSDEVMALDRLRGKFSPKMADSTDAATFGFLTTPGASQTRQFREAARNVARADTLAEFLAEYRKRYPEASSVPRGPSVPAEAAPGEAAPGPGAGAPQPGAPRPG
jgi:hypothetical protein